MTRPDDVPESVWAQAVECTGVGGGSQMAGVVHSQRVNIARAILAAQAEERERQRGKLFDGLEAQYQGWAKNPDASNAGTIALGNAMWMLFPEFRDRMAAAIRSKPSA